GGGGGGAVIQVRDSAGGIRTARRPDVVRGLPRHLRGARSPTAALGAAFPPLFGTISASPCDLEAFCERRKFRPRGRKSRGAAGRPHLLPRADVFADLWHSRNKPRIGSRRSHARPSAAESENPNAGFRNANRVVLRIHARNCATSSQP